MQQNRKSSHINSIDQIYRKLRIYKQFRIL